jgi:hypothetical protein
MNGGHGGTINGHVGSKPSTSVTVLSDTQLQAVVPRGTAERATGQTARRLGFAPLNVSVTVTTGPGSATLAGAYQYEMTEVELTR